jgi:hypothetical protein
MTKKLWVAWVSTWLMVFGVQGCASVHSTYEARPVDAYGRFSESNVTASGLRITGGEMTELASSQFGAIALTFENTSHSWLRVRRVSLDFGGAFYNQNVLVPWGSDIDAWYQATTTRNAVRDHNRDLALAVLGIAGTTVAAASSDPLADVIGGTVALASLGTLAVEGLSASARAAGRTAIFPETHLLAGPFGVPPNLFSKKWILLQTSERAKAYCIESMFVTYELEERGWERVLLEFKSASAWQRAACGRDFGSQRPG